ncbi:MAG: 50S ribosomal protein L25/general stress protein Ctc [Flavobacteriia bacterium]|nr:50S ribosomal protein L25/general stress protein Ctc [Flavobacteriia bacterium]
MKVAQLSGSLRTNVGKKDAKALRAEGRIPCVLYGQGSQTHFSVKSVAMEKLIFTPEVYQIELDIEGKKSKAIIQDLQQDPIKDTIRHVDFYELNDAKPVKVGLPVRVTGNSRGVMAGGKLAQVFRRLTVVGLPKDLPDAITIDITNLRIGQSIRVGGIEANGLQFLEPANAVVVAVRMSRGASKDADKDDSEE